MERLLYWHQHGVDLAKKWTRNFWKDHLYGKRTNTSYVMVLRLLFCLQIHLKLRLVLSDEQVSTTSPAKVHNEWRGRRRQISFK